MEKRRGNPNFRKANLNETESVVNTVIAESVNSAIETVKEIAKEEPAFEYVKEFLPPDPSGIVLKDPNLAIYWDDLERVEKAQYRLPDGQYFVKESMIKNAPDREARRVKASGIDAPHGNQNTDGYVIIGGQGKGSIAVCAHKDYCKSRTEHYRKKDRDEMKKVMSHGGRMSLIKEGFQKMGARDSQDAAEACEKALRDSGISREDARLVSAEGGARIMNDF